MRKAARAESLHLMFSGNEIRQGVTRIFRLVSNWSAGIFRGPSLARAIGRRPILAAYLATTVLACGTVAFYYLKYAHIVDATLRQGTVQTGATLYAAPRVVAPGEEAGIAEL